MVIGPDTSSTLASAGASISSCSPGLGSRLPLLLGRPAGGGRAASASAGASPWDRSLHAASRSPIGLSLGIVLDRIGLDAGWWLLGVALCSDRARDPAAECLQPTPVCSGTRIGAYATLGTGVAGELWPIVFISVFLTGVYGALGEVLLLIGTSRRRRDDRGHPRRPRPAAEGAPRPARRRVHATGRGAVTPRSSSSPRSCSWPWMPASTSSSARSRQGSWSGWRSTHPTEESCAWGWRWLRVPDLMLGAL